MLPMMPAPMRVTMSGAISRHVAPSMAEGLSHERRDGSACRRTEAVQHLAGSATDPDLDVNVVSAALVVGLRRARGIGGWF